MEVWFMTEVTSAQATRFIRNPDVVIREEDEDGALIFNPDTDQIRVLNLAAFFIWNLCDGSNDLAGIVSAVRKSFDTVPDDQVDQDIKEYIEGMIASGFIGTVEEKRNEQDA
jgi:hypothetical protein